MGMALYTPFLLVLFYLNTIGDSQLIGEEKKYAFLEQAVFERLRSTLVEMAKDSESKVRRLEMENKRILSELIAVKAAIPSPDETNGRSSGFCMVNGLECPRFHMDPATLYKTCYLSRDNRTLFNTGQDNTHDSQRGTNETLVYRGVQGSRVITATQIIYFETEIYYQIIQNLTGNNLVFEVGFATEKAIGESYYVGKQKGAWSINAYKSSTTQKVMLQVRSEGSIIPNEKLSDTISGTEKYLMLGFFINRLDRIIAVFDINMKRKVFTFTDVASDLDLWPVFGVYNHYEVYASIRLKT